MKEKVSIVVPIYNVELYLIDCVNSLINQTHKNIEILLVDDGSTDKSGEIAEKFKKVDRRIKVFHKKNGGLSDARNYGIKKAIGEYICFVDSDDYVTTDYVESMLKNIKSNKTKIAACGFCHLYENGKIRNINYQNIKKKFDKDEAQIYLNVLGYYNVSACNKLFSKDLFETIKFPIGLKSEDWYVMYKLIEKAGSIFYDSENKYIYRQRAGSISKNDKINTDVIIAARNVYKHFKNNSNVFPYAAQSLAFAITGVYNNELCRNQKANLKKYKKEFDIVYTNLTYSKLSFSRKLQLILFRYFINIYNIIFLLFNYIRKKRRER